MFNFAIQQILIMNFKRKIKGLAILSIGNETLEKLEYKNFISQFASQRQEKYILNEIYYNIKILNNY